jgi:exopolysaccharide production protein ExoZ
MTATKKHIDRYQNLDLIRGVSILMVLLDHHAINKYFPFLALGHGVDVFFVLSGFLIGMTCLENHPSLLVFVAKRSLRIYPLYFVLLAIFVIFNLPEGAREFFFQFKWHYLLFFSNLIWPPYLSFAVLWSLAVEEHFYLSVCGALLFPKISLQKKLFGLAAALIVLPLLFRGYFIYFATSDWDFFNFFYPLNPVLDNNLKNLILLANTCARVDQMGYGLMAAVLYRGLNLSQKIPSKYFYLPIGLLALTGLAYEQLPILINHSVIGIGVACLTIISMQTYQPATFGHVSRFVAKCGKYSYGIYLLHPLVLVALNDIEMNILIDLVLFIGLSFLVATLSYQYFEKYFIRMGKEISLLKAKKVV